VPLGSYLMCFRFMQVGWSFFRTGELPHHDHGAVDGLDEVLDETEALEAHTHLELEGHVKGGVK
jgi:C4-dicarboxylate transporter DctQ subunit